MRRISRTRQDGNHPSKPHIYTFTKKEIQAGDISRFMKAFGPKSKRARDRFGSIHFQVSGYKKEIFFLIPEVREYLGTIQDQWPCWLFYGSLDSPCLRWILFAVSANLDVKRVGYQVSVAISQLTISRFLADCLGPLEQISNSAKLTDQQIEQRSREILNYFAV
jgi:hypothetical protein